MKNFFRNILIMLFSLLITLAAFGALAYYYLDSQLPDVEALKSVQLPVPLRVYTSEGKLLSEFGEFRGNPVKLNQVPPLLIKAILATEDQRFFDHPGIDIYGLIRAATELILTGTKAQGGSTITMQVARNFYLTRKKTFMRKITEILLSLKIEREFTKEQILELYLNKIYLGNRAYGVSAAAQIYYGKPLDQLNLAEIATIAGLPKAPSTINPIANPIAAKQRRDHVLARMYDEGYITKKQYENALTMPVRSAYHGETVATNAPYVAEMVRDMMVNSYGEDAYTKGYNVYTTINSEQQQAANTAVRTALLAYDHRHGYRGPEKNLGRPNPNNKTAWLIALLQTPTISDLRPAAITNRTDQTITALLSDGTSITLTAQNAAWAKASLKNLKIGDVIRVQNISGDNWQLTQIPQIQGALIALNPQSGAINALVGGFDFRLSKFNRVTQAQRQPGSNFKPFIYAAGLAKGYTLASIFNDAPLVFNIPGQDKPWKPQNDKRDFNGPTRLRFALARSINLVSVRLLQAIDVPYALNYLARFGFDAQKLPRNLSLALGSGEVTPLELARAYAVLANGGYRINPYVINRITDTKGQVFYEAHPKIACSACITAEGNATPPMGENSPYAPQAIPPQIAFLITSALKDVIRYGTGHAASVLNRNDLAAKTGTTNDKVDTWFSGFNGDIVATSWVGFDQPTPMHEYGSQAALPLWVDFMRVALQGKPEHTMAQPPDIVSAFIDATTGLQVPNDTPGAIKEFFRKDNIPQQQDTLPVTNDGIAEPLF